MKAEELREDQSMVYVGIVPHLGVSADQTAIPIFTMGHKEESKEAQGGCQFSEGPIINPKPFSIDAVEGMPPSLSSLR